MMSVRRLEDVRVGLPVIGLTVMIFAKSTLEERAKDA